MVALFNLQSAAKLVGSSFGHHAIYELLVTDHCRCWWMDDIHETFCYQKYSYLVRLNGLL